MDLSYIPLHLQGTVKRQADGWPEDATEAVKDWAMNLLKDEIEDYLIISLNRAIDLLFGYHSTGYPKEFNKAAGFDYQGAFVDRALRATGAEQVWVLPGRHP